MSNKRKKCRLLQNLYSIFLLNSKKRKKCRTKREKCRLFKISIRHFFLNNKKRKKCRTIRHFCIRHFFIDSAEYNLFKKTKIYCFLCRIFGEHSPSMDKLTMKSNQNHICDQLKIKKKYVWKKCMIFCYSAILLLCYSVGVHFLNI